MSAEDFEMTSAFGFTSFVDAAILESLERAATRREARVSAHGIGRRAGAAGLRSLSAQFSGGTHGPPLDGSQISMEGTVRRPCPCTSGCAGPADRETMMDKDEEDCAELKFGPGASSRSRLAPRDAP